MTSDDIDDDNKSILVRQRWGCTFKNQDVVNWLKNYTIFLLTNLIKQF